jgi:hypothetical protein
MPETPKSWNSDLDAQAEVERVAVAVTAGGVSAG